MLYSSCFSSTHLKMWLSCLSRAFPPPFILHPSNLPRLNLTPGIYQASRLGLKLLVWGLCGSAAPALKADLHQFGVLHTWNEVMWLLLRRVVKRRSLKPFKWLLLLVDGLQYRLRLSHRSTWKRQTASFILHFQMAVISFSECIMRLITRLCHNHQH